MSRKRAPEHNLTVFGLQVTDAKGEPVGANDATGQKYYRNMVISFFGRHFPHKLFEFFPDIRGVWEWGPCADKEAFEKFLKENMALILNKDGSVTIRVTSVIDEVVYHPDKEKRYRDPTEKIME